jgi:hypothetical protein
MYMNVQLKQIVGLALSLLTFRIAVHAQEPTGTLVFGGRKFTVAAPINEMSPVIDKEYGVLTYSWHEVQLPIAVSGEKIYKAKEVKPATSLPGQPNVAEWLALGLKQDLLIIVGADSVASLRIDMRHVVTDATGKIIFYRNRGAWLNPKNKSVQFFDSKSQLSKKIDSLMEHVPTMQPAMYKGQPVAAFAEIYPIDYVMEIRTREGTVTAVYNPLPNADKQK